MARETIPADATIATIRTLLSKREEYVRVAFHHAHVALREDGIEDVRVRIGVSGTGDSPNFRIERLDSSGEQVGDPKTFRASGRDLFEKNDDLVEARWSEKAMSYAEVRDLLGEIRGFGR